MDPAVSAKADSHGVRGEDYGHRIATPLPEGATGSMMDVDHEHEHSVTTTMVIPSASYTMPPPTWRVKTQFAAWEIDHTRFEVKRLLGKGSYGSVAEAIDHLTGARVAIKKIANVFEVTENAKRIYREVHILRMLSHPNVIKIVHVQQPSNLLVFSDLYIVFECLDTDAAKLIRDETQCLTVPHCRWFLYQLLLSVKYVHSARILHRDIKPANILLTESCDLKLCDFGLARSLDGEEDETEAERSSIGVQNPSASILAAAAAEAAANGAMMRDDDTPAAGAAHADIVAPGTSRSTTSAAGATSHYSGGAGSATGSVATGGGSSPVKRSMTKHVVTRWYRAPELPLYNDGDYSTALDVWSIGCCFAELLGMLDTDKPECRYDRKALFPGGACFPMSKERAAGTKDAGSSKSKKDQLAVIFEVLGTPTEDEIRRGVRTAAAAEYLHSLKPRKPEDLAKRFPTAGREALELLRGMLRFNPGDRITIDEALAHPFLAPVRRPHDEVSRPDGAVRISRVREDNVRDLIVDEIRAYNPHIPANWREIAQAQAEACSNSVVGDRYPAEVGWAAGIDENGSGSGSTSSEAGRGGDLGVS